VATAGGGREENAARVSAAFPRIISRGASEPRAEIKSFPAGVLSLSLSLFNFFCYLPADNIGRGAGASYLTV